MQTSKMWNDIMRWYSSKSLYTEPYNPQQNPAERAMAVHKNLLEKMIIKTGCDLRAWYKLSQYICAVTNRMAKESLEWRTPYEIREGETPDISPYLLFEFWERVYYLDPSEQKGNFPETKESAGRWLGVAENHGDGMAFYILTEDTEEIIVRGTVRSAERGHVNRQLERDDAETEIAETENPGTKPVFIEHEPFANDNNQRLVRAGTDQ
jgi:hypothetical protein